MAAFFYRQFIAEVVLVSSTKTAEMAKLLENTFRSENIALVNEVALMCDRLGVDVWEVIDAAGTKPFGFMPFYPGPGLGGHCIPIDPHYLAWKLRTLNFHSRFIELAGEITRSMPAHVVSKVVDALNHFEESIRGSSILVLGVTYKPDVADIRESPALDIMQMLVNKGAKVSYNDPFIPEIAVDELDMTSEHLSAKLLESKDCVVIATNHSEYDAKWIVKHSGCVVDTRNATKDVQSEGGRVVKL
jgi:UDP-N-acetyl-D-glucosamine dehydrogenase